MYHDNSNSIKIKDALASSVKKEHSLLISIKNKIPILNWIKNLTQKQVPNDIMVGFTIGIVLIPQSMSYADIAGLPYIYGLYASLLSPLIYSIFGSSHHLSVGPTALISLIIKTGLDGALDDVEGCNNYILYKPHCTEEYINLTINLGLISGLMLFFFSFLNIGYLVNFISEPVMSGFISASAMIIGLSQVKHILGFDIKKSKYIYEILGDLFTNIRLTNSTCLITSLFFIIFLMTINYINKKYKNNKYLLFIKSISSLLVCLVGIILVHYGNWDDRYKIKIVGDIPGGLPPVGFQLRNDKLDYLIPTALSLTIVGFLESIAITKSIAQEYKYKINANQELLALGIVNIICSIFSGYPTTGSFSRSSISKSLNSSSQLTSIIVSITIFLTLLVLTKVFKNLPKLCLGCIVISSVVNLVDIKYCYRLFLISRSDCLVWITSFLGTLFLGVEYGLLTSVLISLFIIIKKSIKLDINLMWKNGDGEYIDILKSDNGYFPKKFIILKINSSIYFANVNSILPKILEILAKLSELGNPINYIIIDMSNVTYIDITSIKVIESIITELENINIRLLFVKLDQKSKIKLKMIDYDLVFSNIENAIKECRDDASYLGNITNNLSTDLENLSILPES